MSELPCTTPSEARRVWEAMGRPSSRRVARKLTQSGRRVSHETINRWRSQGWRSLQPEPQHPLEAAREQLDDAAPLLTGNPLTTAKVLVEQSADRETLEQLSDEDLLRQAAREALKVVYVAAKAMLLKPSLAVTRPAEFAFLAQSLAECLQAATAVLSRQDEKGAG